MWRTGIVLGLAVAAAAFPAGGAAQIMVTGSPVQERTALPGGSYTSAITIRNNGTEARAVRVYQTDYAFQADGTNSYSEAGSHPRSNARWMSIGATDVVVPAGQATEIAYRVSVPADPSLAGTYWSMVMVEPTEVPSSELAARREPAIGVRATVRFGIQIATHVQGEARHRLRLGNPQVLLDGAGKRTLQFELVNNGEIAYRPKASLEVYDGEGGLVMTMEMQRGLIYPGTSALQQFALSELPSGEYQAVVVVDTGSLEVFGAQFNLTIGATR